MKYRLGRMAYRLLLRLLPPDFRAKHGAEMEELFFEALGVHWRRAVSLAVIAWFRGVADVVELAIRLRSKRRNGDRTISRGNRMEAVVQDLRFALRSLSKAREFVVVGVLTLALGIGANTAIFSLVNGVLLRAPEHIVNPDELVSIWTSDFSGPPFGTSSYMDYVDYRDRPPGIEDALAVSPGVVNMAGEDGVTQIRLAEFVSGNYFDVLGVAPRLGRWFTEEEGDPTSAVSVAVISEGLWERAFGLDSQVLGRTARLSGQTVTIVGVAPAGFTGSLPLVTPDFWIPVSTQALIQGDRGFQRRGSRGSLIRARLHEGVSIEAAQAQLDVVASQLLEEDPGSWTDVREQGRRISVVKDSRLPPQVQTAAKGFAALLMAVTGIVLLIACANMANLTLARASRRNRELAVRLSLGAGRGRIVRQLLAESGIVGVLGGLAGAALTFAGIRFAESYRPATGVAISLDLGVDGTVLIFSIGVTLLTVIAVGLLPALRASRPDLVTDLKEGGNGSGAARRSFNLRNALVVAQVSASLVLLVGAGLFLKSLQSAMRLDAGFEPEGLATVSLSLAREGFSVEEAGLFYDDLNERVAGLPGVESTALTDALPLTISAGRRRDVSVPGYEPLEGEDMEFQFFAVSPGYFATLRTPLRAGREFTDEDGPEGAEAVIVNAAFAEYFWPGEDPLGKLVNWSGNADAQVVGVAADAAYRTLNEDPRIAFFTPLAQTPSAAQTLIARTDPDRAEDLLGPMRAEVMAINSRLPISSLRTVNEAVAGTLLPQRIASWLLSIAGGLGLLLASVGLYGVMTFLVAQRTGEIGVRMALGASQRDVVRMVVRQGLRLAVVGSVVGLLLAGGVTRFLESLLYGVNALDMGVFIGMPLAAMLVAGVASFLPARKAASVDPAITLREE